MQNLIPPAARDRIVSQTEVWRNAVTEHLGANRFTMAIAIAQEGRGRAVMGHFITENDDIRAIIYALARAVSSELVDGPLAPDDVIAIYPVSTDNLIERREVSELARAAMELTVDKPPGMAFTIAQILAVAQGMMQETIDAVGVRPLTGDAEAGRA